MISVNEAIEIVREQTGTLSHVQIPLAEAMGRILAEDVISDSDLPPFDRAQMDGYAVRAKDVENVPARLRVVGESAAGRGWHHDMKSGEAVRIMTGAPVPDGADSVQQVEVTSEPDGNGFVDIARSTSPGQFIALRASEVSAGTTVLNKGEQINAAMMAVLASFGYASVLVGARPRVSVLATGTELVPVDEQPQPDQIRDSNSYSLSSYASLANADAERLPLAGDDPEILKNEILEAAKHSDMIVLSGGVSMGVYDFTKTALKELGAEIFFERVSLRPGKPTVFARLGDTIVFGLPGNPVSVSVTFNLFARTSLMVMQGASNVTMPEARAVLSRRVRGALERESFLPASVDTNAEGRLIATPLKWGGSSDFVAFARATALVNVSAGVQFMEEGETARIVRLPG